MLLGIPLDLTADTLASAARPIAAGEVLDADIALWGAAHTVWMAAMAVIMHWFIAEEDADATHAADDEEASCEAFNAVLELDVGWPWVEAELL